MTDTKYNAGARALHWLIALLIVVNIALGLLHDPLEEVVSLMPAHKAIGMSVLALSVVRLGWRMAWTAPAYPASMTALETRAAKLLHGVLYLFMIAMPLSGWIMSSAGKYPLSWFGLFDLPKLPVVKDSPIAGIAHEMHEVGGYLLIALVLGHVLAALRHHFVLKDGILRRML
ncbi:cytochrome b [Novosphingobium sp. 1949]|uniref:Cytochrome b n=1 Tax=Novosphingobium organovorum TaxID=2930092 RepID=A0ABT0BC69_9SPHN|nr:cytochrome b [Novosphingobium organovorum]MCJ2182652.1 cytochrome b [Novosphingobium organovorum]